MCTTTPRSSGARSTSASIADGTLPAGYATDDGVGVLYRGTEMVEALSEVDGAGAYFVERGGDGAVETQLDVRRL